MKVFQFVIIVLLALGAGYLGASLKGAAVSSPIKESAYERVMRTKTLRCGYTVIPPHLMKDANSGEISGIGKDIAEAAAKLFGWKVEWAEEVPIATIVESLKQGRYDMICTPLFIRPNNMALVEFVGPLFYTAVNAYARPADVARFDSKAALAAASTRIGMIDGTIPYLLAKEDFPDATHVTLPEMADYTENLLLVTSGKADVVFVDRAVAGRFLKQQPGALAPLPTVNPLRVFPLAFNVAKGEQELANTLTWAVEHLRNNGLLEPIIAGAEPQSGTFLRVKKGYLE